MRASGDGAGPRAVLGQARRRGVAGGGGLGRRQPPRPVRQPQRRRRRGPSSASRHDRRVRAEAPREAAAAPAGRGARAGRSPRWSKPASIMLAPAAAEEVRLGLDPADDQPVAGPGQGDVEQPQRLVHRRPARARRAPRRRPGSRRALRGAQRKPPPSRSSSGPPCDGGAGGGVGQDHDRRLQALGAVRGHHPHLALALPFRILLLALHLDLAGGHLGDEPLQLDARRAARPPAPRRGRRRSRPRPRGPAGSRKRRFIDAPALVETRQHPSVEVERRARLGLAPRPAEEAHRLAPFRAARPARPAARPRAAGRARRPGRRARSSSMSQNGLRSSAASVRSSSAKRAKRPSAKQVLEGDVLGEQQPVGAADGHASPLQRPDDLVEQGVAAAHQDQHVAVAHRPAACRCACRPPSRRGRPSASIAPAMRRASFLLALSGGSASTGAQGSVSLGLARSPPAARGRPSRRGRASATWLIGKAALPAGFRPAAASGGVEHRVDERQHLRRRAPALQQRHLQEPPARAADQRAEALRLDRQPLRRRALEREDRLLLVAHREHGAMALAGALADEELGGQSAQDVPLLGGGVLRLVEQHVVDAAVELEEHPGGVGAHGQQLRGCARSGRRSRAPAARPWRRRRAGRRRAPG